jgi:hypothetical protein
MNINFEQTEKTISDFDSGIEGRVVEQIKTEQLLSKKATRKKYKINIYALCNKIKYWYWKNIPYQFRPSEMWYTLKCFLWKRYTVIKPRYLPYTWCDRVDVLPHMMFEILSQFIEQECSPGHVDWEGTGHMVVVNGESVNVRDEMQELYDWWHNVYMKEYEEVNKILWKEAEKHNPIECEDEEEYDEILGKIYIWNQHFKTTEDKELYHKCLKASNKLETIQNKDLLSRMHRVVNLTNYLWT